MPEIGLQHLIDLGVLGILLYWGLKTFYPDLKLGSKERQKVQDNRYDKLLTDNQSMLKETSAHIAISNANYDAAAKRDELMIGALHSLKGSFDAFSAKLDAREKYEIEMDKINDARFAAIQDHLGEIRQQQQIRQSAARQVGSKKKPY